VSNEKKKNNNIKDIYSLSPMQEGMLYYSLWDKESNAYFEQSLLSIEGSLNMHYLEESFNRLIERYDILRTVFVYEKVERPVQVVMKSRKAYIPIENIEDLTEAEKKAFVEEFKMKDRQRGFNLSKDILMRMSVIKTDRDLYKLIWSFHHIIMDGWCMAIIRQEFLEIYNSLKENRPPKLGKVFPYSDYIRWLARQNREEAALYWDNYLDGYSEQAVIPSTKAISANEKYKVAELTLPVSENIKKSLEDLAGKNNVTLNTIVQSAWGVVVQKYNNSNDVVFGAVVSGRPHEITGIESMVGLFINTLPVRITCNRDEVFSTVLYRVQNEAVESERYSYCPLAEIQARTSLKGALIDHIVVFENYPVEEALAAKDIGIVIGDSEAYEQTNYNLNVIIVLGKKLTVKFNYNAWKYDESFIRKLGEQFRAVLNCIIENPNILVRDISLLTKEERRELLVDFNNTQRDYPKDKTVQALFEDAVARNPENIAVVYDEQRLTYQELNSKANQLARVLVAKGIKPASIVGILAERSPELIVGIMGILKAGATYLPIDPEYPEDRIGYMLEDSGSRIVLTQRHLKGKVDFTGECIELDDSGLYIGDDSNLSLVCNPRDLAYVIYTSGSTGKPKGVEIEQVSLVNLVSWHQRVYTITELDRATLLAGQAFDASVWEIWPYLTCGAGLYIPQNETRSSVNGLINWLKGNRITISFMPTPMVEALMGEEWPADMSLRALLTGGDKLHCRPSPALPFRLFNHYGPTESTVVATWGVVSPEESSTGLPSIGHPIDNTQIYIVDKDNQLQPVGVPGELCITGDGLARGYLNRSELTAERFVENPFAPGTRMYRTGDLAKWLPDGNIEFIGRIDYQVKIRGFRVELGEIEAELLHYPAIKEVCVIAKEDVADQKYLCAYFVAENELNATEIKECLKRLLPEYMVPSCFVQLEKMPLTPNGKIDRKALPEPEGGGQAVRKYIAPRNEAEEKMAAVWQEVLGTEKVGMEDNFFELGGHSLKAMNLVSKIHKVFGAEVQVNEVFKAQSIKELMKSIAGVAKTEWEMIEPVDDAEYYPVSPAQKRMFILNQLENNSTAYNIAGAFKVEGGLDRSRLVKALRQLVQRHETLRTSFEFVNGEPVQRVQQEIECTIDNLQGTEDDIPDMIRGFVRPFNLSKAPLFRIGLGELTENKQILLFDMHHIISDGVSMGILVKELAGLYMGQEMPELRIQYKDFSVWQDKIHCGERFKQQEEYWLRTFEGELPVLNLQGDYSRPPVKGFEGDRLNLALDEALTGELKKFAGQTGTTLYMVLLAAYNVLLSKYTGQEDIVVGSPIAGRTHADVENMIGMFINTLAMRNYPAAGKTFREFLQEVKENALAAYDHQEYQFEELVDKLAIPRNLSRTPLFDTMFVLQNMDMTTLEIDNLKFTPYEFDNKTAKFDLTLRAAETNNQLEFTFEYYSKLFKRETVQRLARHFVKMLKHIVEKPDNMLTEIELLAEDEKKQIVVDFNNTKADYPADKTLHELFEERAAKTPDNVAVTFADQQLTYQELNDRANQLAGVLRDKGIRANRIVGIMVERSLEMIIGILGILKAGGAYLPIAPEYPEERVSYTLKDSGTEILLTQQRWISSIAFDGEILALDDQNLYQGETKNVRQEITSQDAAYVIYTSGSTGKPKGVLVEHRAAVNMVSWMQQQYPLGEDDVILQKTPFTFDASGRELLWWIVSRAKLCFLKPGGEKDPAEIFKAVEKNKITVINFVPAALNVFLEYITGHTNSNSLASLRKVFVGGEALKLSQVERFNELLNKRFNTKLINLYGPTEATIDVSCYDCSVKTSLEVIPIGKPINNLALYIVGRNNQLQPIGVAGEVCIAGAGLARGYVNRPELTAEKFVENPFMPDERMYRTGDLGRWLPDGNIEYLGRIDHQVKIRGFRIELGEIEAELLKHPEVKEAVVIAKEDTYGNNYLCAYFVAEKELTTAQLREHLALELPDYMIPSSFVQLTKMPLTSSAKIDRKALPEPEGRVNTGTEYLAPANEREETLIAIWGEVLGVEKVGMNDNFFDLGGHSIKAIALVNRIHREFGAEIGLQEVFKAQTPKELFKIINRADQNSYMAIPLVEEQAYYPVSSAQKRMFILQQFQNSDIAYNMPAVFTVEGDLVVERLEGALRTLVQRNETLRSSFEVIAGEPVQRVHKKIEFAINCIPGDAKSLPDIIQAFVRPFDLSKAPLLRVGLVELAEKQHVILCDMHHIISDGISREIFVRDLTSLYEGRSLPELRIQYKDFSAWQNKFRETEAFKKQESYWLNVFTGELPVLNMPSDYPRPAVRSLEGERLGFTLGEEVTDGLKTLAAQTGTSLYMVLLAAYNVLLSKYAGQADIVVGAPITGRSHADLENIIGMFVNTLAMRNYPEGSKSFEEFLQEVKINALAAYDNQAYQFEELVDKLAIPRELNRNPLFDTMFVLQDTGSAALEMEGLKFIPYKFENKISKFDFTLQAAERDHGLEFVLEYYSKLFKQETIERMSWHFVSILQSIVKQPQIRLDEIEMLTESEKKVMLSAFNNTETIYPKDKTIHELFEEQVAKHPDSTAVTYGEQQLTYQELNDRANQLARVLRKKGVKANCIVGMLVERSPEMIIGILGILKAGGAYMPIDPEYPEERISYMLTDSKTGILVTQKSLLGKVAFNGVNITVDAKNLYHGDTRNVVVKNSSRDLAYVIYTSGSTGKPKGNLTMHYNVVRVVKNTNYIEITGNDVLLQLSNYAFDGSVFDIYGALLNGARLVLVDKETVVNMSRLPRLIEQEKVTVFFITTALFNTLADLNLECLKNIRKVLFGGEQVSVRHVRKAFEYLGPGKLLHVYGPTESTVYATYYEVNRLETDELSIPIGAPIANTGIYILDQERKLQPIGVPGELCIFGDGLAQGYLNRPELTDEKFVEDSFRPGTKMYRTGDLARWLPDGNIDFLGRMDYQVKLRGFRIELGEIEAALINHPLIRESLVVVKEELSGYKYLCAYIVTQEELTLPELRKHLLQTLPEYMIPASFVQLEKMPLTPNGKIDRKALPEPAEKSGAGREYVAPRNAEEEKMTRIWRDVLSLEKIGIEDNFFELGGHSLKVITLIAKIQEEFGVEIIYEQIFKTPNIKEFTTCVLQGDKVGIYNNYIKYNTRDNNRGNLFFFPPAVPLGLIYRHLATHLADYTLFCFNLIETKNKIREYVQAITDVQPQGPYILVGFSAGGTLTYEVARELEKQGYQAEIILLDCQYVEISLEVMDVLMERFDAYLEDLQISQQEKKNIIQFMQSKTEGYLQFLNSLLHEGKIMANIHHIYSANKQDLSKVNEWAQKTEGSFSKYEGLGSHDSMLEPQYAGENAKIMREILEHISITPNSLGGKAVEPVK